MSNGTNTWNFTYNSDGLRTKRTNGTTTYHYVYNGDKLSQMTVGSNLLQFSYDAAGTPMAVLYNGTTYYYATNLQGDVIAILDATGAAVVEYTYDAWGNLLATTGTMATTLGTTNPLRYRGYVYDSESELYYLQSRYYNPEVGRFLNADAFTSTGQGLMGCNMLAYCQNNPINNYDPTGCWFAGALQNTRDGFLRESGSAGIGATPLSSLLTYVAVPTMVATVIAATKSNEKESQKVAVVPTTTSSDTALYYPADIVGDYTGVKEWRVYPEAMNYSTAIVWVVGKASSGAYGKNASWGLYTIDQQDAFDIATALGGATPCLHENRIGEYPHYHTAGMVLFGEYKHFHVWYGSMYAG